MQKHTFLRAGLLVSTLVVVSGFSVFAQVTWNQTGTANWQNANNWTPTGTPTDTTDTRINNGGLALIQGGSGAEFAKTLWLGQTAGSSGNLRIQLAGNSLTVMDQIDVGRGGTGGLTINNGGVLNSVVGRVGAQATGNGTVLVSGTGSQWNNSGNFRLGNSGSGVVTVQDGGLLNVGSGTGVVWLASGTGSSGILNIGSAEGDAALGSGVVQAGSIVGGDGSAVVNFNHNDATRYEFSTVLAGTLGVVHSGSGTTVLSGSNTYSGVTTVKDGILNITNAAALGSTAGGTTVANGGSLQLEGGISVAGEALTLNGQGFDDGALRSNSGSNEWTGLVTLGSNSRINAAAGSSLLLSGGVASSNRNLRLGGGGDIVVSGLDLGTGSLTRAGAGTATLIGSISYSGGTIINSGTLKVGNGGTTGSISGNVTNNSTLVFHRSDNLGFSGDITGSGSLLKLGEGRLTLTGANDFTGGTTISEGNLRIGNGGTTGSITGDILNNATLVFNRSNDLTYGGSISGSGAVIKRGAGDLVLTGTNTHSGRTRVREGRLDADVNFALSANSALQIDSGATVRILSTEQTIGSLSGEGQLRVSFAGGILNVGADNTDTTFSGTLTGNNEGMINKIGTGMLSLTGANSYGGGVTVTNGTLRTTNAAALGSGGVSLEGGSLQPVGTLSINSLSWTGGTIASTLGTATSFVNIAGNLNLAGGGEFLFAADGGFLGNTPYLILSATNLDDALLAQFSGNQILGINPTFTRENNDLYVTFLGAIDGKTIQNSSPVFTPTTANFTVNGPVSTGGPLDNNTVNGLIFNPGSSLQIFNNLTVTSGNFDVPTGSALMTGGNVIVPGVFTKLGGGILNIFSNVFVTGPANVVGGSLLVNGTFNAPGGLTVFQNALLGGAGIINGSVFNNGIVAPGNSPGVLTINGNFVQSSSGTLQIEFGDLLRVSGSASLAGTLQYLGGNKLRYGQQITFLEAGSITGEFDEILMPNASRFRGRFLADGGTGTLLVAPTSYTLVAETTNQRNVAKALDSFITARGDDREVVSIALDLQSEEQYPAAFDAIAPTYYESLGNIVIEQAFAQTQQMNQRLSAVRLGARGFQAIGVESPLVHDKDGKSVLEAKDTQLSTLNSELSTNWNLWAMGNGLFAKVTNVSQVPDYRFDSGGFLFGADYTFGGRDRSPNGPSTAGWDNQPYLTLGLYAGYEYTWADAGDAGNTQINSALFGGYASFSQGGFYADAIVGGGYNGYQVRRSIEFSTVDRTARSQPNGGQLNTSLNLGYDWQVGKFTLGPIAGVQYTYAGIAGFTETGADSLDLRVAQQNVNSLRTTLGGRVAYTWNLTDSIALIPEVRMFWQHEFLNNPRNISSSLDGGAGPTFGYETSAPARDSVFAGAGVSAQFGDRWNAFVYYNVDFGRQDYFGNMISGGVNWKW